MAKNPEMLCQPSNRLLLLHYDGPKWLDYPKEATVIYLINLMMQRALARLRLSKSPTDTSLSIVFTFLSLLMLCSPVLADSVSPSKTLDSIRERGVVRIGIKTDFAPFGMLNSQGESEGLEVDLAADIAQRLGVKLVKVSVTTENRLKKLEQGDVDVLMATTADTFERRQVATAIEPNYYAGGVTVFLRPDQRILDWQALRGQKLCALQAAYFNRPMSKRYLLDLQMYKSPRDALLALRDNRCVGYLYTSVAIQNYMKKPEWSGYKAPLPLAMVAPWAIYVSRKDQGTELERKLGDIVAEWHRNGLLIEKEKAWGVLPTKFLKDTNALWTKRDANGEFICKRGENGAWSTECRNPTFVRSGDVGGLQWLGLWIEERTGLKLTLIYDGYDRSLFFTGMLYTLFLMGSSVFFSLLLGAMGALLAESRFVLAGKLVRGIAVYGRMTPPLLQMYLLFFGVGALLWSGLALKISPILVAVFCLSYYTGASIMTAILEAAEHIRSNNKPEFKLGISNFSDVVELSAIPVKAALTNVVKQSILASALAIPELINAATSIMSDQGNVTEMMNIFLLVFLLFITSWLKFFDWLEARLLQRQKGSQS